MQNEVSEFRNFSEIYSYVKNSIFDDAKKMQQQYPKTEKYREYKRVFDKLQSAISENTIKMWFEWTQCEDPTYNKYYLLLLKDLYENADDYQLTYNLLSDAVSKEIYTRILLWRLTLRSSNLVESYILSNEYKQYLDHIARLNSDEIIIDGGGYIGDSTLDFIMELKGYKKIYLFEPDKINLEKAKISLKDYENITFINAGLGKKNGQASFDNK